MGSDESWYFWGTDSLSIDSAALKKTGTSKYSWVQQPTQSIHLNFNFKTYAWEVQLTPL